MTKCLVVFRNGVRVLHFSGELSLYSIQMASIIFDEPPKLSKDRWGISTPEYVLSADQVETEIRRIFREPDLQLNNMEPK